MQTLKNIFQFLSNKYFLATAFFLSWIFFFAQNDVITQYNENKEWNEMKAKIKYLQTEIDLMKKEREALKTNSAEIEKYAREKYLMHKSGEDIFVFDTVQKAVQP